MPAHRAVSLAIVALFFEGTKLGDDTNLVGGFAKGFYFDPLMATFGRAKRSHSRELPPNFKLNLLSGACAQSRYNGRLYANSQNVRVAAERFASTTSSGPGSSSPNRTSACSGTAGFDGGGHVNVGLHAARRGARLQKGTGHWSRGGELSNLACRPTFRCHRRPEDQLGRTDPCLF